MKHAACTAVANRRFPSGYGRSAPPPAAMGKGFTLIELLVVIAIIALLISIILPSLGSARATARTVICTSNLRQLGIAIQGYMSDQKDPRFLPLLGEWDTGNYPSRAGRWDPDTGKKRVGSAGPVFFWQVGAVFILQDYLSNAGNAPFNCPSAKGPTSVRLDENVAYLQSGSRFYTYPNLATTGGASVTGTAITAFTEYWFNDSGATFSPGWKGGGTGVSARPLRLVRRPDATIWSTDWDEAPRHTTRPKARKGTSDVGRPVEGANNALFGDLHIEQIEYTRYLSGRDKYKSIPTFYNWGHAYVASEAGGG